MGGDLLALWNGVEGERAAEYDLWHTREHVPERVAVPGMLGARRYVGGEGALPGYLTLYELRDLEVLESAPYRALLERPTAWSARMRPSFRGFLRLPCRGVGRVGGGVGGALMATTLGGLGVVDEVGVREMLLGALRVPEVTAARLAVVAGDSPGVPFSIGGEMPDYPRDAVLLLEGYDRGALVGAFGAIEDWFGGTVLGGARTAWTVYSLGYLVGVGELGDLVGWEGKLGE